MSVYPQGDDDQKQAALPLMVQALSGNLSLDWDEVTRLARLPGFKVEPAIDGYFLIKPEDLA